MDTQWQVVKRGGRRRTIKVPKEVAVKPQGLPTQLRHRMSTLESLPWCAALLRELPALRVVCYGLGSIFASRNAQGQFALALLMAKGSLEVYDPVLQRDELEYLEEWGCRQAQPPETRVKEPTLFFMPHCPQEVYVAVLKANDLNDVVILGNSFESYARRLDVDPVIAAMTPSEMSCDPGPSDPDLERAFNDTSLLRFR